MTFFLLRQIVTAALTANAIRPVPGFRPGLTLAALSAVGLTYVVDQARRVRKEAEKALTEGLGYDYVEQLDAEPTPADLAVPWRKLVYPFRLRSVVVRVDRDVAYAPEHGKRDSRHLPLRLRRPQRRTGAAAGPRRWLEHRGQEP